MSSRIGLLVFIVVLLVTFAVFKRQELAEQCPKEFQVVEEGFCVFRCPITHIEVVSFNHNTQRYEVSGCRELTHSEKNIREWIEKKQRDELNSG